MIRSLLDAWPSRRRVTAALLLPVVTAWFMAAGASSIGTPSIAWYALTALASVLGAGVLATYVPVVGRRLDLGCTPCTAVSALTVVGATIALRSYGADLAGPLVAIAVLLFGLTQRLNQPPARAAPER